MSACECAVAADQLLGVDEALERLLAGIEPLSDTETLPLDQALGRVLATDLTSPVSVPGADNSAMDGYALRLADLNPGRVTRLAVDQRIPAGSVGRPLRPNTAARIFTGAPIPPGCDAVVIQERCEVADGGVLIHPPVHRGQNIRRAGEDTVRGASILGAGTRLEPQHLGLAAAVGLAQLPLIRRPRVAVLSTGDEVIAPGNTLRPGQLFDANRTTLMGLIRSLGGEVVDLGIVPDRPEAIEAALGEGARRGDLIVTSGGVSVGEEDHVKAAVQGLGRLDLWRIAIKPGKPLAFGRVGRTPFLGLPGNPVSLLVTFLIFARPLLLKLVGADPVAIRPLPVPAGFDWPRPDKRREYLRARLDHRDGEPRVVIFDHQGSGVLSSVAWAEGLVMIPPRKAVVQGEPVDFLPFAQLLH